MSFVIKYKVETNDHDGYCSGNDCEYNQYDKEVTISHEKLVQLLIHHEIIQEPYVSDGTSGYCDNNLEAQEKGIDRHDCRVTILDILLDKKQ